MLESSIFELRHTVTELEKSLNSVENEGKWITIANWLGNTEN